MADPGADRPRAGNDPHAANGDSEGLGAASSRFAHRADADADADGGAAAERDRDNPLHDVVEDIAELKTWGRHWLTAKLDGVQLSLRRLAFVAVLGIVGGLAGAALIVTAAVLLLTGLARAVDVWLDSAWIGSVAIAVVVFALLAVPLVLLRKGLIASFREQLRRKYEALHASQRIHRGSDVEERAHELAQEEKEAKHHG